MADLSPVSEMMRDGVEWYVLRKDLEEVYEIVLSELEKK